MKKKKHTSCRTYNFYRKHFFLVFYFFKKIIKFWYNFVNAVLCSFVHKSQEVRQINSVVENYCIELFCCSYYLFLHIIFDTIIKNKILFKSMKQFLKFEKIRNDFCNDEFLVIVLNLNKFLTLLENWLHY